jgi:hypothetical protein
MFRTTTLAGMLLAATLPLSAQQPKPVAPQVPPSLEAPAGARLFAVTHAEGTQNYICLPSGGGVAWTHLGPQATLFDARAEQRMTHFLSGNPLEDYTPRATWLDSQDSSQVWAVAIASYSGAGYVEPNAVPWLLLRVVGAQYGPTWGDRLARATFIQRFNTSGGVAPAEGCSGPADTGRRVLVPYSTDYAFYR